VPAAGRRKSRNPENVGFYRQLFKEKSGPESPQTHAPAPSNTKVNQSTRVLSSTPHKPSPWSHNVKKTDPRAGQTRKLKHPIPNPKVTPTQKTWYPRQSFQPCPVFGPNRFFMAPKFRAPCIPRNSTLHVFRAIRCPWWVSHSRILHHSIDSHDRSRPDYCTRNHYCTRAPGTFPWNVSREIKKYSRQHGFLWTPALIRSPATLCLSTDTNSHTS
jgi:hypothetical protein